MYQAVLDPASGKWRLSSPSAQPLSRLAAAAIRAASITCAAVSSTRFDMCGQVPADLEPIPRPPTLLYLRLGSAPGVRRDQQKCLNDLQDNKEWVIWCKAKPKDMATQAFRTYGQCIFEGKKGKPKQAKGSHEDVIHKTVARTAQRCTQ